MQYSIQPSTEADLPEMTEVMVAALLDDLCWQGMKGSWTYEEEYKFTLETLRSTMVNGLEVGNYKCWKVIDETGLVLPFPGIWQLGREK